jgi:hypothetical protein
MLGCALAFIGLFFEAGREMSASTSSTAALVFLVVPFVQAALLVAVFTAERGRAVGDPMASRRRALSGDLERAG